MSDHNSHLDTDKLNASERTHLGDGAGMLFGIAAVVGAIGLVAAIVLGFFAGDGFRRFYFAYLTAYAFFVTIALGSLAFVMLQHISRAGWSASVRRIGELLAATFPVLAVLSLPILVSVLTGQVGHPLLYRWAQPIPEGGVAHHDAPHGTAATDKVETGHAVGAEHPPEDQLEHGKPADHTVTGGDAAHPEATALKSFDGQLDGLTYEKRNWLNPPFFIIRVLGYLVILSAISLFFWRTSLAQDVSGDVALTLRMQKLAAPAILITGISLTLFAFDVLMSLDPHWFSTMYGVYYLAGSFLAGWASIIIVLNLLQGRGYLRQSIHKEHFHDLGKYLFGFVFFWGYIAFSQYMLLWYANMPETTGWLARRGMSTVPDAQNPFTWVILALLFGQFLIPFAGLLSRHVKRNRGGLLFWAVWVLAFHYLDMVWLIKPELSFINGIAALDDYRLNLGLLDVLCVVGIGGVFIATFAKLAAAGALLAMRAGIATSAARSKR